MNPCLKGMTTIMLQAGQMTVRNIDRGEASVACVSAVSHAGVSEEGRSEVIGSQQNIPIQLSVLFSLYHGNRDLNSHLRFQQCPPLSHNPGCVSDLFK